MTVVGGLAKIGILRVVGSVVADCLVWHGCSVVGFEF